MKEINETLSQISTLKEKLSYAETRLQEAGLRQIGLQVGDRIEVDGKGIFEVTNCHVFPFGIWPVGLKVKKDGTTGKQSSGYIINNWRKL